MKPVIDILEDRITKAMQAATGRDDCAGFVRASAEAKFGDYQANGVMALAKKTKTDPRKLAEQVVGKLDVSDMCEQPEIAGPGFINLRLKTDFVAQQLLEINKDSERLGIDEIDNPKTIVVDFSGPNIAKQMHVGHLRSTIIGDCICRTLEFLGHTVIPQNHIGDWGLQMGMVIYALEEDIEWQKDSDPDVEHLPDSSNLSLELLEKHYKKITELVKNDITVAEACRKNTVALQANEGWTRVIWQRSRQITLEECLRLYKELDVILKNEDTCGESFYKDKLADIVKNLEDNGFAEKSDGAVCVFPEGFKNKHGNRLPFIIQKSDGAYLYATTDLAAIRYRVDELKADKIIYVTDARQKLHFEMLFAVAKTAGWAGEGTELEHVTFGSVLGQDRKPLKTRAGENVKLKELLDEATQRARAVVEQKNPDLSEQDKAKIARSVGIGAVKYADYSNNRTTDYIFSFDKMLAMEGNTAPYMQYAYARIKSIERKAEKKDLDIASELAGVKSLDLSETAELDLAKHLLRYGEAIESAAADCMCNYLTSYLYDLAQKFSGFYTNCPVLGANESKRPTRVLLCDLTAKTIEHGLSRLLGIEVVEQM